MSDEKEVTIVIRGKNLGKEEFEGARKQIAGLGDEAEKTGRKAKTGGADTGVFTSAWGDLTKSFSPASLAGMAAGYLSIQGITQAGGAMVDFLMDSVQEYAKAEAASNDLNTALQKQHVSVPLVRTAYDQLGAEIQRTTVFSKGMVTESQTLFATIGNVGPAQMGKAITAATNLATVMKTDLQTASLLLAKGFASDGESLGKLKQIMGDTIPEGASMEQVLDAINQKFDGKAAAQIETYSGQVKQLGNSWSDVKEQIGESIASTGILDVGLAALQLHVAKSKDEVTGWSNALKLGAAVVGGPMKVSLDLLGVTSRAATQEINASTTATNAQVSSYLSAQRQSEQTAAGQKTYTDRLKDAQVAMAALTPETLANFKAAEAMGAKTEDLTKIVGGNAAVVELLKTRLKDQTQAETKATAEATRRREALEAVRAATTTVTDAQQGNILSLAELAVAESDIALQLGLHEAQVGRVIAAEKERAKAAEAVTGTLRKQELERVQDFNKAQIEIRAGLEAIAARRIDLTVATLHASQEAENSLRLMFLVGHAHRIEEIRQEETAAIAAARTQYDETSPLYKKIAEEIRVRYQHERDLANATQSTIVERMREQGVMTRAEQEATVAALKRDYLQMLASGKYTYAELEAAERRWRAASRELAHEGLRQFVSTMDDTLRIMDAVTSAANGLVSDRASMVMGHVMNVTKNAQDGMKAFMTGDMVGMAAAAIKTIGSVASAVKEIFGNDTKKGREEFAAGMNMTLSQLMTKLQSMGAKGQELANQALNVIGKHDEAGNKRWMKEVEAFFGSHQATLEREAALLDEATISWQEAEDIAREFGITTTNSGKALEQAKIAEQGENIAVKWRQATLAGMDFTDVTTGMSDEVQALINKSNEMGVDLPASLKKPVEEMIKLGLLTDANGEKITDMGAIRFSETPIDRLVTKMDELLTRVFGLGDTVEDSQRRAKKAFDDLGDNATDVGSRIHKVFDDMEFEVPVRWNVEELPNGAAAGGWTGGGSGGMEPFASGGMASGPLLAQIEPGRKEIIGDVSFMTTALTGALERLGRGGSGGSDLSGSGGAPITIVLQNYIGNEKIDERIIDVTNRGLQGQRIQVPATAISGRSRF